MKRENNSLKRILVLIKIGVAMIIVLLAALVVVHYIKDKSFKASEANENELAGDIDEIPNGDDDYVEEPVYVEVLPSDLFNASTVGENESITYGIDVSKHQGTIDWEKVAAEDIEFAMIRVGYRGSSTGAIEADSNAAYNLQEAEKYGVKIGVYFFSTAVTEEEAKEEADWVTNVITKYPITYPVVYDCEGFDDPSNRHYGIDKDKRSNIAIAFMDSVYAAGYTPMIYSAAYELIDDTSWNTSELERKYKVWLARYTGVSERPTGKPDYYGQCSMWQYTDQGYVDGISGNVDLDVAYFGYDGPELAKNLSPREEANPDVEANQTFKDVDEQVTALVEVNLRDKPTIYEDSNVLFTLKNGQVATRTGLGMDGWSRLSYEGVTCYAVTQYLTTDLEYQTWIQKEETSEFKTKFTPCAENVTAKERVNLRSKPSVTDEDSVVVYTLEAGEIVRRTGINFDVGWSRVEYNGQELYCVSSYIYVVE